jgi:steroid delta-isomerase-like uncharacterized protein
MATENKSISRRVLEDVFTKGDLGVIDQLLASNHVNHDPANPPGLQGPEGFRQIVTMYRTAFPDLRITVDEQFGEGDRVVTRWTATGTHRGPLGDLQPTNRRVTITGIAIDRLAGGRIAESWVNWDSAGMMQQLGAIPKEKMMMGGDGKRAQASPR